MRLRTFLCALLLVLAGSAGPALARDELVTTARTAGGETIPYILTSKPGTPAYAVILMPGGPGRVNPRMMDGKLVFSAGGNFLIRSRELFADGRFVAVSTDATSTPDRMLAIIRDLQARYGQIAIYVIGTSRSTEATMALARPLDGWAGGFRPHLVDERHRRLRSARPQEPAPHRPSHPATPAALTSPVRRRGVASKIRHRADRDERRHVDRQRLRGLCPPRLQRHRAGRPSTGSRPGSPSPRGDVRQARIRRGAHETPRDRDAAGTLRWSWRDCRRWRRPARPLPGARPVTNSSAASPPNCFPTRSRHSCARRRPWRSMAAVRPRARPRQAHGRSARQRPQSHALRSARRQRHRGRRPAARRAARTRSTSTTRSCAWPAAASTRRAIFPTPSSSAGSSSPRISPTGGPRRSAPRRQSIRADRAWFDADRQHRELLLLRDLGYWSHFPGDASMPLHTSAALLRLGPLSQPARLRHRRQPWSKFVKGTFVRNNIKRDVVK